MGNELRSDRCETTEDGLPEDWPPTGSTSREILALAAAIDEAAPLADPLGLVGARVGRFRVAALLGKGGMGVVYRAADESLRRDVALKVLPPGREDDEDRRRRLLHEARAAAAVNHPSIATIYEVGEADGRVYIAMELVPGKTLADVLRKGRLPVHEVLCIARGILNGLGKAHEAGLVHHDLTPRNVMLTDDGAVKVLDFGLAQPLPTQPGEESTNVRELGEAETVTQVSTAGRVAGAVGYMSPEQARGEAVDARTDVFAFGVVLYEMLTGQRPFGGRTLAEFRMAMLRDEPEAVSKLNPEVPAELAHMVERCLAREAAGRYGDCKSLVGDLDRVARRALDRLLRPGTNVDDAQHVVTVLGTRIGRFRVVGMLGMGGFGGLYRAIDERLQRDVALELLPTGLADDEEHGRRHLRELRAAAAVSHPALATIYEVGEEAGRLYVAMELVQGRDLAGVRRLPVHAAVRIAHAVAQGVGAAHAAGLVHRNLKPNNVLLTDEGAVKVLGLGMTAPPRVGQVVGTPSYMSPEQVRGEPLDPRSDVFSFGVVLYEALTGRPPFGGATIPEILVGILRHDPPPVSKLNPEVPAELSRIVEQCLAKDAGRRYADCRAVTTALERAAGTR